MAATTTPRPARTQQSFVWGYTRAKDLHSGTVFRWTRDHNDRFRQFVRVNGTNSRTTADLEPLLDQLNLNGFEGIRTDDGVRVEFIILKKVKDKLYRTEKEIRDGGEMIGIGKVGGKKWQASESHPANSPGPKQGLSSQNLSMHSNEAPSLKPPPYQAYQPLMVAQAYFPPDNVSSAAFTAANVPQGPARSEELTKTQQQPKLFGNASPLAPSSRVETASEFSSLLKIPKGYLKPKKISAGGGIEAAVLGPARKAKADRVLKAWSRFHEELLEVDQEPDDEHDDEKLHEITSYMLEISDRFLKRNGVELLLKLAGSMD